MIPDTIDTPNSPLDDYSESCDEFLDQITTETLVTIPVEVTEEMIEAGRSVLYDDNWDEDIVGEMDLEKVFMRMLEAAEYV